LKIGEDITLIIKRAKGLELFKKHYKPFEHIWLKNIDPENYGF